MNIWGIPDWLEKEVRARDKACIYCGIEMLLKAPRGSPRKNVSTWEHIINDARIITRENIALCCCGCNASKGSKWLSQWLGSSYCTTRGMTKDTIAAIAQAALIAELATSAPG